MCLPQKWCNSMRARKRKVVFPSHLTTGRATKPGRNNHTVRKNPQRMEDETVSQTELFLTQPPLLTDTLVTPTSILQGATLAECLPLLNGLNNPLSNPFDYDERGLKQLDYQSHIAFAEDGLSSFPAPFVTIDASRPWMIYWALTSLHFLGEDVSRYRHRIVKTYYPLQNSTGGYGGGQGHSSHLAAAYATILSLALAGGTEAYELTDRQTMWSWLGRLKQANGGFQICEGGEEDTRAAYCALLLIALLDLPWHLPPDCSARSAGLKTFGDGLGEYISRCQTYEGGISSEPGSEAHGAYTFCALAALSLLDAPHISFKKYLDIDLLLSWLTSRQYSPEGGFAGRSNKVVDGCYSHWIGDCFPLVQAALTGPVGSEADLDVGNLYSTEGLSRYILNCCQNPDGGLRDKPSKRPDSYHTCYTLAGLSAGEYYHYYTTGNTSPEHSNERHEEQFDSAFAWRSVCNNQRQQHSGPDRPGEQTGNNVATALTSGDHAFRSGCELNAVHPVFVVPHHAVLNMRDWSTKQPRLR